MAADPQVAQEVQRQRELRRRLQSAFADVLHEPVPERLLEAARGAPASPHQATVTDLSQARSAAHAGKSARRWSLPQWAAMAACLIVGLFLGQQFWRSSPPASFTTEDGRIVASGALAQALSSRLSNDAGDGPVRVVLSFRDRSGDYCRTFVLQDGNALAGLACRKQNEWRVQVLAGAAEAQESDYRMAGGALPASVLQAAQERIDGEPLDLAAETAARDSGWR